MFLGVVHCHAESCVCDLDRYVMYGNVMRKAAEYLHDPDVLDFFVQCLQRVMPKSTAQVGTQTRDTHVSLMLMPWLVFSLVQCVGEVKVVRAFLENFSGDQVGCIESSVASLLGSDSNSTLRGVISRRSDF